MIEHEKEWHLSRGPQTQPLPRITSDMAKPPASPSRPSSESYIDLLFG